jgi:glycopeptide antibiotics resistance protein
VFKKIAPDKWKHFFVGIAMGAVLQLMGWWLLPGHIYWATIISFVIVFAVSYGFELFSKFTGFGYYDILDAVASIIGGVAGMGVIWMGIIYCR